MTRRLAEILPGNLPAEVQEGQIHNIYFILFRKVRHLLSALMFGNMSSFTSQRLVKED